MISSNSLPRVQRRRKMKMAGARSKAINRLTLSSSLSRVVFIICSLVCILLVVTKNDIDGNSSSSGSSQFSLLRRGETGGAKDADIWVGPDAQNFNDENVVQEAEHLIMVAGHSVIVSGHLKDAGTDEKDWYLLDYQKGHGLPQAILAHIRKGIELAALDRHSLLVFSGGETRPSTGPINEGSSYFHVADAMHLWDEPGHGSKEDGRASSTVRARAIAEEFATDSFQNLMFSICRFKEVTGHYPRRITVVSYSFKKRRFEELHAAAIQWPSSKFDYVGIDPDASTGFDLVASSEGERTNSALPFESDPYGCNSQILQDKRKQRNPFSRTPPYELTCPEMRELLKWCSTNIIPSSKVPW
mmetsp:Transcript_5778/g.8676  ORF Transcript_5778/g.8676 Transcript_5778/m.8676 type:complete len:358 (-) Transcript_5778:229-1302(-)